MASRHLKFVCSALAAGLVLIAALVLGAFGATAKGAQLQQRQLALSNSGIGANNTYHLSFQIATPGTLGSISVLFCANDPLIEDTCTAPAGLDASQASLTNQTGETGFSVSPASTANHVILTRAPASASAQTTTYDLANIINPSSIGSYYARLQTFASSDASGTATDFGGLAFSITNNLSITSQVPPYITFCAAVTIPAFDCSGASGAIVNLGQIESSATQAGQSQLLVATNAGNGYTIYMQGTTLTSGNNVIDALSSPSIATAGSNQFGLNLRSNLLPPVGQDPAGPGAGLPTFDYDQPNRYKFVSGDAIASAAAAEDYRRYTVSYIADAAKSQPAGVYVSTITYIAVGNF